MNATPQTPRSAAWAAAPRPGVRSQTPRHAAWAAALWQRSAPCRFLFVGAFNFAFGYAAFAMPYLFLRDRWPAWLIGILAAVIGITEAFLAHKFVTYRSHGCWWREYLRFYVVYGVQSALNVLLLALLVSYLAFNAYLVQLLLALVSTIGTYWVHKRYSFALPLTADS